jgi:putative ABC transport system substrate-binding protein
VRRREFITLTGGAAAWPLGARAQQRTMPIVGLLTGVPSPAVREAVILQGLAETGFVEGRNISIERRSADAGYERLPELAVELTRAGVAVIAAMQPVAALAAKAATTTIPIVFVLGSDPVKDGLVASYARPGGNITGVTFFSNLLAAKELELLRDIMPNLAVTGLMVNPNNPNWEFELKETQAAAATLGVRLVLVRATTPSEVELAFVELVREQATALVLAGDAYLSSLGNQIATLALQNRIATCFPNRFVVEAGGLVSYAADRRDADQQFGRYIGRVLKGEKPGDLPVVQPTKFEIVVNLKSAKLLGLTISRELLFRADEVIE